MLWHVSLPPPVEGTEDCSHDIISTAFRNLGQVLKLQIHKSQYVCLTSSDTSDSNRT